MNVEQIYYKIIKIVKYIVRTRLLEFHAHIRLLYPIKSTKTYLQLNSTEIGIFFFLIKLQQCNFLAPYLMEMKLVDMLTLVLF